MIGKTCQCPMCGCKVFSVYDSQWRVVCSHCEYEARPHPTELGAEKNYREDFNKEFDKGIVQIAPPKEKGWISCSDRIPDLIPGDDGWDNRQIEIRFKDGFEGRSNVGTLHEDQAEGWCSITHWRWYAAKY